jgi:tRNA G10  N-methylase Trm11
MGHIIQLGREAKLSMAELESLHGADNLDWFGVEAAILENSVIDLTKMGGSIRVCRILDRTQLTDPKKALELLKSRINNYIQPSEGAKIQIGISMFGQKCNPKILEQYALNIKKILKARGDSVRVMQHKDSQLSAATVLNNKLAKEQNNYELCIFFDRTSCVIARTEQIQDIDEYARRDQGRPARDARVGMLPPKLAQIIINLSQNSKLKTQDSTILDPFCGTGVVLQEALLIGHKVIGTDLEPRMIEYSAQNLEWLGHSAENLCVKDASKDQFPAGFTAVACETYLGMPLATFPTKDVFDKNFNFCAKLVNDFLRNLAAQTVPGFRACIAVPFWQYKNTDKRTLPTIALFDRLGYNIISLKHTDSKELFYSRPDQVVGRQLIIIERK